MRTLAEQGPSPKFVIAGIDIAQGRVGDDHASNHPYFELGWEVVTTHFDVKRGKVEGWLDSESDVIVTCSGREFMYQSQFSRVMSYREFLDGKSTDDCAVIDLTARYWGGVLPSAYFSNDLTGMDRVSKALRENEDLMCSMSLVNVESLHFGKPYCCFAARRRDHCAYRNMTPVRGRLIVQKLTEHWGRVFVVGHGVDDLCINRNVIPVDLTTYASLIADSLCDVVVGTMTGTMQLAGLISKARICLVITNYDAFDVDAKNSPLELGRCVRASDSKFVFVPPSLFDQVFETWLDRLDRQSAGSRMRCYVND
ncbi:hypothetical protein [Mesorhizobium sp. M0408]|uniref:hypothetical protein n=1 Tax=Mesorhizobium sp. M0408 TaxID=2956942 RepID=UPI0033393A57